MSCMPKALARKNDLRGSFVRASYCIGWVDAEKICNYKELDKAS